MYLNSSFDRWMEACHVHKFFQLLQRNAQLRVRSPRNQRAVNKRLKHRLHFKTIRDCKNSPNGVSARYVLDYLPMVQCHERACVFACNSALIAISPFASFTIGPLLSLPPIRIFDRVICRHFILWAFHPKSQIYKPNVTKRNFLGLISLTEPKNLIIQIFKK